MSRRNQGFILPAALWMLAALATLASSYAAYVSRTAPSASLPEERLRTEAAIRAGIELCAFRQLAWPKLARPDSGGFSTHVGQSLIDVAYSSENARIDLNAAPSELIAGLFIQLGASANAAGYLADRVLGWRSQLKDSERQREAAIYAEAGLAYRPPGAPFRNALEISLLPGMSPAFAERVLHYVTVYSGIGKINPLIADPLVLAALPGITPSVTKTFLSVRNRPRPDPTTLASMAGPVKDQVSTDPSDKLRVEITVSVNARRVRTEVVMKINEGGLTPYDILYWRDNFDGGA
jgi:general secretion pathway protein K